MNFARKKLNDLLQKYTKWIELKNKLDDDDVIIKKTKKKKKSKKTIEI